MRGKSADIEYRELAFKLYHQCGGNISKTLKDLKAAGYSTTRPTLTKLATDYNFKDRLAEADSKLNDIELSTEEELLASLIVQKKRYETYFEGQGKKIDNQAQYAYQKLVTTIIKLRTEAGSYKESLFLEFFKGMISFLSTHDPEAVAIIDRNFDDYVQYMREKNGK